MDHNVEQAKPKCGLLALLPKPKNNVAQKSTKSSTTLLVPTAVNRGNFAAAPLKRKLDAAKASSQEKPKQMKSLVTAVVKSLVGYGSSSEDESANDENNLQNSEESSTSIDLFGLSTNKFDVEPIPAPSILLQNEQADVFVGPAKPVLNNLQYSLMDESQPGTSNFISDEQVSKMIYEKELAPYGGSSMLAAEAASNIIDVNVDQAIGPNVRENLLKNLNNKAVAQIAVGPLPKVKKDPKDKMAKRKHQITHLAGLAVAREEMLQEQWADNKQKKRASARRYGF